MKDTTMEYSKYIVDNKIADNISPLLNSENDSIREAAAKIQREFNRIKETSEQILKDNQTLRIGIVGQVKAGKSSFLNSLFFDGENVLPRASTPMTAGLTVLRYGEDNVFEIEYYSEKEWKSFEDGAAHYDYMLEDTLAELRLDNPSATVEDARSFMQIDDEFKSAKELVERASRKSLNKIKKESEVESVTFRNTADLQNILEQYVGANGDFTSVVKSLIIYKNDERLRDIEIVDTPGVNDPVVSREQRTREFLRGCHGVFFLSYSSQFFNSTDVTFLCDRIGGQGIGTVVLIASKFDSVLQDVGGDFHDNLGNAIEYCERKLKKQYQDNISKSNFSGDDPIFDLSAGIGYSIFKKDNWDATEKHVVERMQKYYPSFFGNMQDTKKMFFDLSNIDTIQNEYLEKIFKQNKERIMKQKMTSFQTQAEKAMKDVIEKQLQILVNKKKNLEGSDKNKMKQEEDLMHKAKDRILSHVGSLVKVLSNEAEAAVKTCMNLFQLSSTLKTRREEKKIKRESTSWLRRNKEFFVSYDKVDANGTVTALTDELRQKTSQVVDEWERLSKKMTSKLVSEIHKIISGFEAEQEKFDGTILNDIVDEIVSELCNNNTLQLDSYLRDCKKAAAGDYQDVSIVYTTYQESESEARERFLKLAEKKVSLCRNKLDDLESAFAIDLNNILKEASKANKSLLTEKKDVMIRQLSEGIDKHISELANELKDKETQMERYTEAVAIISKL